MSRTSLAKERLHEMLHRMLRIRLFDECASGLMVRSKLPGLLHNSMGQEAEIVGSCMTLRDDDYMTGNHRSHGHPIGEGVALAPLMAERTGMCRGKGGSMHLADFFAGSSASPASWALITYGEAPKRAAVDEMRRDSQVFVMGQDVQTAVVYDAVQELGSGRYSIVLPPSLESCAVGQIMTRTILAQVKGGHERRMSQPAEGR